LAPTANFLGAITSQQLIFWRRCWGHKEEHFQRMKKTSRVNLAPVPANKQLPSQRNGGKAS
jgi:hypothetical protein